VRFPKAIVEQMSDERTKDDALSRWQAQSLTSRSAALVRRGLAEALALQSSTVYFYRGRTKQDNGDLVGAIVDFDQAIEIDPRHARYYFRRGAAKQGNGDLDDAIADYTKAIEIDPQHSLVYNNRAAAKWMQGDLEGALADYDKAIDTPGRYAGAYINRGAAKQRNGDLDGAITDYTRAIQGTDVVFNSFVAMAYAFRGLAYLWQARDADAQQDFRKCLEVDDSQQAWIERAAGEVREQRAPLSWLTPRYASNYSE
jgi:tetratricopeptide (TPR) repeat protein